MRQMMSALLLMVSVSLWIGCGQPTAKEPENPASVVSSAPKGQKDVTAPTSTPKQPVAVKSTLGLHFDSMEKITKAEIGQKEYKTKFKFTNAGTEDITITKIKSSCVCTVADLEKRVYKPGEQGEIAAEIKFGQEKGRFTKHIYVTARSGDRIEMVTLTIGAIIPEFARITPRFIRWEHGEEARAKMINVKIIHDEPIRVIKVSSSNPNWKAEFKTIKEGKDYSVQVTPSTTKEASRSAILIEMDYPEKDHLVFKAVARVMQPSAPAPEDEGWMKDLIKQDQ